MPGAPRGNGTRRQGRCLPYGDGITFWPLRELVAQAGAPQGTAQELEALLEGEEDSARVAAAVTMAKSLGAGHVGLPTAGNAGGALAAYAARAGLQATIVAPKDTPKANLIEIEAAGYSPVSRSIWPGPDGRAT